MWWRATEWGGSLGDGAAALSTTTPWERISDVLVRSVVWYCALNFRAPWSWEPCALWWWRVSSAKSLRWVPASHVVLVWSSNVLSSCRNSARAVVGYNGYCECICICSSCSLISFLDPMCSYRWRVSARGVVMFVSNFMIFPASFSVSG